MGIGPENPICTAHRLSPAPNENIFLATSPSAPRYGRRISFWPPILKREEGLANVKQLEDLT